jgi:hypothetical protein
MSDFEHRLADLAASAGQATGPRPAEAIRTRAEQRVAHRNAATGVAVVALLGGFAVGFLRPVPHPLGGPSPSAPPTVSASPSSSPSSPSPSPSRSTSPPSSSPPSSDAAPPPAPNCRDGQVRVWQTSAGAAGGHTGVVLLFENVSDTACRLHGYPGLNALGANGQAVAHAKRTLQGYLGGFSGTTIPSVELPPGGFASALAEALSSDPTGANACLSPGGAQVTPPNLVNATALPWNIGCTSLEIHPVVPGTSGRS